MKRILSLAVLVACLASLAAAEQSIYLTDGSVLQGTVIAMDAKQILVSTAFADSLSLPRAQVVALLLQPAKGNPLALNPTSAPSAAGGGSAEAPAEPAPEGYGTLELAIKGDAIKSSVRFRDDEERERVKDMATLYLEVFLDGQQIYEEADTTIEKEFRERQDTYLRNRHRFEPVTLEVPAGVHTAYIIVGNKLDAMLEGENQSDLVSAEVAIDELNINPGQITRVVLEGKGSRWGYGKYELEVLRQR